MGEGSKKLIGGGPTMGFMDECGFSSTPFVARTWGLIGKTPVVVHPFNWNKLSAISVITTAGRLYFRLHHGKTVRGDRVVEFLRQFLQQVEGEIILYWDGLPAHRSRKVKDFLAKHPRLQIRRLPPYCPDLNEPR